MRKISWKINDVNELLETSGEISGERRPRGDESVKRDW